MALREAMKSDTSVSNQINMEAEIKKELETETKKELKAAADEDDDEGAPAAKITKVE